MSAADHCARCKRAAHGGSCAAPQPLAPAPMIAGAVRQLAHVKRPATLAPDAISAARLARVDATADHVARHYRYEARERDAWRLDMLRALATGDTTRARAMCFELDPVRTEG